MVAEPAAKIGGARASGRPSDPSGTSWASPILADDTGWFSDATLTETRGVTAGRATENLDAYNLYLQARQSYVSGNRDDPLWDESIVRLCRRATEIDPNYARAWALKALAQAWSKDIRGSGDGGRAAVECALRLDAGLADAHAVRARHLAEQGQHKEAFVEIQVALGLDTESYDVNESAGLLSYRQSRMGAAIRYFEKATMLMEAGFFAPGMLMSCCAAIGDALGATRAARATLAHSKRALALDQSNGAALGFVVTALAVLGEAERARDWIDRALRIDPDNSGMRYSFACALCRLNDTEAAFDQLGPFFSKTSPSFLNHAKADPDLDRLRDDPRFEAMVAVAEARLSVCADDAKARRGSLAAVRRHTLKQDIVANLSRSELSVGFIAGRNRMTPRNVQRLLGAEGATFSTFVLERRLAQAYGMLTDLRQTDRAIAAIVFDCGFGDISHFNRAFRRLYQKTPSDVRAGGG